jgi:hypothetical protein
MTPQEIKTKIFLHEARRWIGVREVGGDNHGQVVEMFQKAVDGKAQGEPWCLAFAQFCIHQAEETYAAIYGGLITLPLFSTEHCITLWNNSQARRIQDPIPGCLVIWQFWKDGKPTSSGHVGIVEDIIPAKFSDKETLRTIEGNTSDGQGVVREGNGVYSRLRSKSGSDSMKVLGFLKVW